ncbi:MAG: hypothetical protein IKN17_09620 [Ruminococcus sp.]|nr:hypothetical protein [Ruminococcus sp.]
MEEIVENTELAVSEETSVSKETEDKSSLCSFEFNVTIPEEDDAFKVFQRRYVFKRNVIKSIGFGLLGIGFLVSSFIYPDKVMNYILFAVCAAAVSMIWYNNVKIRRSLMEALKMLEDDRYIFTLFEDRFRIETIVPDEERNAEDFEEIPPQEFDLSDPMLDAVEKQDKFVIIVKKATIYVLPKRCMNDEQMSLVREKTKSVNI